MSKLIFLIPLFCSLFDRNQPKFLVPIRGRFFSRDLNVEEKKKQPSMERGRIILKVAISVEHELTNTR
jgi:hypothetical protein